MTQPNLLELAKKGDPRAIAALMNRSLQPKGITATTDLQSDRLFVTLESTQVPNRQGLTTFVQNGLQKLGVQTIRSVQIVGKQTGTEMPAWVQEIGIGGVSPLISNGGLSGAGISTEVPPAEPDLPPSRHDILPSSQPQTDVVAVDPSSGHDEVISDETIPVAADQNYPDQNYYSPLGNQTFLNQPSAPVEDAAHDEPDQVDLASLRGTHELDYPDDPVEEADEVDNYDEPLYVDASGRLANDLTDAEGNHDLDDPLRGTHTLSYPDAPLSESDDLDNYDEPLYVNELPNHPDATSEDETGSPSLTNGATADASDRPTAAQQPSPTTEQPSLGLALAVLLGLLFPLGLIGYTLWSRSPNPPESAVVVSPTSPSPPAPAPASPASPAAGNQANPNPATSPGTQSRSPSPATSPVAPSPVTVTSPVAPAPAPIISLPDVPANPTTGAIAPEAATDVPPSPPALTCPPPPSQANAQPVQLFNLAFDPVDNADGNYIVGCVSNNTSEAIAELSFTFQGTSKQDPSISQRSETKVIFSNLQPGQSVPFRSVYTVNPAVTPVTIRTISYLGPNQTQPKQIQTNVPVGQQ